MNLTFVKSEEDLTRSERHFGNLRDRRIYHFSEIPEAKRNIPLRYNEMILSIVER